MRKLAIAVGASATLASASVFAADVAVKAPPPAVWNWSGFYAGAGGSLNWSHFDQSLQGISGVTNVTLGPLLVAQGQAGGPFFDYNRNKFGVAPDVQLGYIAPFADGAWLAGIKFTYKYANNNSKENVAIPQTGSFTTVGGVTVNFVGFVPILPAEVNLKHQLALIPTIGRAFDKVAIYAGAGPALFGVQSRFNNGVGFAVIGGSLFDVTGAPVTVSNENWVWGGAAQIGATYAIAPRWFLDVGYTYARSSSFYIQNVVSFTNQNGPLTSSGIAYLNAREQITNQSVVVTINRQFW
jgi:opacity protein-like surface antigen